jgi:hypothetical protein
VSIFFLYGQVLFHYVIHVIVLQNAAKHGKLMESYRNFEGARLGPGGEDCYYEAAQDDSLDYEECCKNQIMEDRGDGDSRFSGSETGL